MSSASLIAIVGPSGAGKTTLARALQVAGLGRIATTTTRAPRPDEVVGQDLFSVTPQVFNQLRTSQALIATCEYASNHYGTQLRHLRAAAVTAMPHVIVVEPSGLSDLKAFAREAGMSFAAVFATLPPELVRTRLESRYARALGCERECADRLPRARDEINEWRGLYAWDLIVDSGDTQHDAAAVYDLITRPLEPAQSLMACA